MSNLARAEMAGAAREHSDAYLALRSASGEQQRWPLPPEGGEVTIGRASAADVCLSADSRVSRVHAVLERVGGLWTVVDDGLSRNGTFVNGRRLAHRARLSDRDKIRVGGTVLTFCAPPQTVAPQTVAGGILPAVTRLTEAQRSILVALCRPYEDARPYASPASNQQIATELFLSLDAVKTHLRVLFHKFGIENLPQNQKRARLAELALELGLVGDPQR
ncbi:MAG TPA: FHA domain-containing protein [Dermatophilaceae bacterium]|jgi:DNA-binding CsgD family transcriptional regulator